MLTCYLPRTAFLLTAAVTALILWPGQAVGQEPADEFETQVLPILQQYCLDCHGPDLAESELRLDRESFALRGGDSGERAIVPGHSDQSYLMERILHPDPDQRMPPDDDPIPERAIQQLKAWIDDTQRWQAISQQDNTESQSPEHWSFQPVQRPEIPIPGMHPIDSFLKARLQKSDLDFSPLADPGVRWRRLKLVMHGLPPDPDQSPEFLDQADPEHWADVVDQVLSSPHYGERWATFWLDLVRFGETHGFETNRERPNAWRYRDWVIRSLNDDKPYDQFVREQLAGDALGADVATGFLVGGPYDLVKGQDPLLGLVQRQDELADMINTTGTAFLGLTLGCARCHNHKFDPVSQTDYYAMQAVFAGVQHGERSLPLSEEEQQEREDLETRISGLWERLSPYVRPALNFQHNREVFPPTLVKHVRFTIDRCTGAEPCIDELEVFANGENVALASQGAQATSNGDFVHKLHQLKHINDGQYGNAHSWISSQTSGGWVQIQLAQPTSIDRIDWGRDRDGQYQDRLAIEYRIEGSLDGNDWVTLASSQNRLPFSPQESAVPEFGFDGFTPEQAQQGERLLEELRDCLERKKMLQPATAYAGTFQQPGTTHRLYRGDPTMPREAVDPAMVASLTDTRLSADAPEQDRRLALADWITSPDNPLTARVIVNRIWQHHFGTGIVDTASDFGANGTPPSHPELLDWLAAELMDHDWSLKHIHRLILTSHAWQQDSRPHAAGRSVDAGARLLWRYPARRLEAEAIRDCLLAVTDQLDLEPGGPGFSAFEVETENVRHYHPKSEFGPEDWRRMIYMTRVRQERDAVFGVFDCPDFNQVVAKRSRSTTPLQALNLFNSRFVLQQSELLVVRLNRDAATPEDRVRRAYLLCYGRDAEEEEVKAAMEFIQQTNWTQFARAILNSNEFVFVP